VVQEQGNLETKKAASSEVTAATEATEQLTTETDAQTGILESLQKDLNMQIASTDEQLACQTPQTH